jgi:hypothetical protein
LKKKLKIKGWKYYKLACILTNLTIYNHSAKFFGSLIGYDAAVFRVFLNLPCFFLLFLRYQLVAVAVKLLQRF